MIDHWSLCDHSIQMWTILSSLYYNYKFLTIHSEDRCVHCSNTKHHFHCLCALWNIITINPKQQPMIKLFHFSLRLKNWESVTIYHSTRRQFISITVILFSFRVNSNVVILIIKVASSRSQPNPTNYSNLYKDTLSWSSSSWSSPITRIIYAYIDH